MGKIIKRNMPCKNCSSSDAAQAYEDGYTYCFSCAKRYKTEGGSVFSDFVRTDLDINEVLNFHSRGIPSRLITREVAEFYGIRVSFDSKGELERVYYPFYDTQDMLTGWKVKNLNDKTKTFSIGKVGGVFGINKFRNGGNRLIITEGEEDALSVAVAWTRKHGEVYPVISMGGAQQSSYLLKDKETIDKFKEVILWFDNDKQGQKAVESAARIVGFHKTKVIISELKDANDELKKVGLSSATKLLNYVYNAKEYSPAGIVPGEDTWERYNSFKNLTFIPWAPFLPKLNELTFGRALGTITMLTAGTSVGKTTFLKEDMNHLLKTTDAKIGAILLEEDIGETVSGLMSIHLNKRLGLPSTKVTAEEEYSAWQATAGQKDRIMLLDHQGSISDGSLINKLEFMILSGCKYLYLDHITIAVSDGESSDTNKNIDVFMSELLRLVKRHNCWILVVSHLRKVRSGEESFEQGAPISEDDLKGSGSLKQISFQTIALSRDKMAESESMRHVSQIWLLKDRKTGNTGPAGAYRFNKETGRLEEAAVVSTSFEKQEFEIVEL
jgi:twinkle protein